MFVRSLQENYKAAKEMSITTGRIFFRLDIGLHPCNNTINDMDIGEKLNYRGIVIFVVVPNLAKSE